MPSVRVISHGCKSNQYDGDVIARELAAMGVEVVHEGRADSYVVNTCAVTVTAEAKGRKLLRRLARIAPGRVIATGCAAQVSGADLAAIPGVASVLGNERRGEIAVSAARMFGLAGDRRAGDAMVSAAGRTRAFVKVQDGCDMGCSYCIIRIARGPVRSRPRADVVQELRWLAQAGVKEVVLTGIRLGAYRDGDNGLAELLNAAGDVEVPRIRVSSMDVWDVSGAVIEALAANRRICPHLHLPLQSGDAAVLRAMRRPYTPEGFAERVQQARDAIPGISITSDVMVGFPGETEEAVENTARLARDLQLDGLHVFRFSARPGTAAAKMAGQVRECVKRERCQRMLEIARGLSARFAQRFVGKIVEGLFETHDPKSGSCEGLSEHYLRVTVAGGKEMCNRLAPVLVERAEGGQAAGTICRGA